MANPSISWFTLGCFLVLGSPATNGACDALNCSHYEPNMMHYCQTDKRFVKCCPSCKQMTPTQDLVTQTARYEGSRLSSTRSIQRISLPETEQIMTLTTGEVINCELFSNTTCSEYGEHLRQYCESDKRFMDCCPSCKQMIHITDLTTHITTRKVHRLSSARDIQTISSPRTEQTALNSDFLDDTSKEDFTHVIIVSVIAPFIIIVLITAFIIILVRKFRGNRSLFRNRKWMSLRRSGSTLEHDEPILQDNMPYCTNPTVMLRSGKLEIRDRKSVMHSTVSDRICHGSNGRDDQLSNFTSGYGEVRNISTRSDTGKQDAIDGIYAEAHFSQPEQFKMSSAGATLHYAMTDLCESSYSHDK